MKKFYVSLLLFLLGTSSLFAAETIDGINYEISPINYEISAINYEINPINFIISPINFIINGINSIIDGTEWENAPIGMAKESKIMLSLSISSNAAYIMV
jgi:hypothetical protein